MIVVSDASPLIGLARIDRLDLLTSLFGMVLVPPAVYSEITQPAKPASSRLQAWSSLVPHRASALSIQTASSLDPGESSAIALSLALRADLLLLDERKGRRVARDLGIPIMGALGVILRAKQIGLIDNGRSLVEQLATHLFIGRQTFERMLLELGEPETPFASGSGLHPRP